MATKYTKEVLEEAVKHSESYAGVLRHLGLRQAGGTQTHIIRKIKTFEINTSHFTGQVHNKNKPALNRKTSDEILITLPEGSNRAKRKQLMRAMIDSGIEYICGSCSLGPEWQELKLTLEIDHIDGNWLNNLVDNLRFLCPNCHSQESTSNRSWKYSMPV